MHALVVKLSIRRKTVHIMLHVCAHYSAKILKNQYFDSLQITSANNNDIISRMLLK